MIPTDINLLHLMCSPKTRERILALAVSDPETRRRFMNMVLDDLANLPQAQKTIFEEIAMELLGQKRLSDHVRDKIEDAEPSAEHAGRDHSFACGGASCTGDYE